MLYTAVTEQSGFVALLLYPLQTRASLLQLVQVLGGVRRDGQGRNFFDDVGSLETGPCRREIRQPLPMTGLGKTFMIVFVSVVNVIILFCVQMYSVRKVRGLGKQVEETVGREAKDRPR